MIAIFTGLKNYEFSKLESVHNSAIIPFYGCIFLFFELYVRKCLTCFSFITVLVLVRLAYAVLYVLLNDVVYNIILVIILVDMQTLSIMLAATGVFIAAINSILSRS